LSDPEDGRPPAPGRTQLRRPSGIPESAPLKVAPLPPLRSMPGARPPMGAPARPMAPRPRPILRGPAVPTLAERLGRNLPLWMLYLTIVPVVSTVLRPYIGWPVVLLMFIIGSVPSVFLIPALAFWQIGFLLHLYLKESELLDGRLLAKHLLAAAFGAWVWMYCMPPVS
jgi:hypothetical protein